MPSLQDAPGPTFADLLAGKYVDEDDDEVSAFPSMCLHKFISRTRSEHVSILQDEDFDEEGDDDDDEDDDEDFDEVCKTTMFYSALL